MRKIITIIMIIFSLSFIQCNKKSSSNTLTQNEIRPPATLSNTGVILGNIVNVRSKPSLSAIKVSTVRENEYVTILNWTNIKQKIGMWNDRWVEIKTVKGVTDYIYGAFIFDLNDLLKYKWIGENNSFDTGEHFIFFHNLRFSYQFLMTALIENKHGYFKINGRKLTINHVSGKLFKTLYLYKRKGKHLLLKSLFNINFRNFEYLSKSYKKEDRIMHSYQPYNN